MKRPKPPLDPFEFQWWRPAAGVTLRWAARQRRYEGPSTSPSVPSSRWVGPSLSPSATDRCLAWPGPERPVERYDPLHEETTLYWQFAELQADEAGVLNFTNRFGPLVGTEYSQEGNFIHPLETSNLWMREVARMRAARDLHEAIRDRDRPTIQRLLHGSGPAALASQVWVCRGARQFNIVEQAWLALLTVINNGLTDHVSPLLLYSRATKRPRISIWPGTLLGAMWTQMAQAVEGDIRCQRCGYRRCHKWIEIAPERDKGRTRRAEFCSDTHRVAEHKARKAQALRLARKGKTASKIAAGVKVPVMTVRRWLEQLEGTRPASRQPSGSERRLSQGGHR